MNYWTFEILLVQAKKSLLTFSSIQAMMALSWQKISKIQKCYANNEPPNPNAHKAYFEVFPSHECQGW